MTIDLRSDTVTQPTAGMRAAMADAEVGDDVYGQDPTVNRLQMLVAERLDAEAALFVPSGTQSNLCALLTHCGRGDEYIAGQMAHTYRFEAGGAATLGGIQPQPIPFTDQGTLDLDQVAEVIKPDDFHFARTKLLCLENTQAGKAIAPAYFEQARRLADERGLRLHLDGARLFNAAIATGSTAADYARYCDSVSVCLSKGLGAPVGSVLVGDTEFITRARRWRKMLGGGMRQAGVLAAAGIYAIENHIARLAEDHERAARLAEGLSERIPGRITHHTNMVFVETPGLDTIRARLANRGIAISGPRWVVHLGIADADVERVLEAVVAR